MSALIPDRIWTVLAGLLMLAAPDAFAANSPLVVVESWAQHSGPNIVYRYRLRNTGEKSIFAWKLGYREDFAKADPPRESHEYTLLVSIPLGAVLDGSQNEAWKGGTFTWPPIWKARIGMVEDTDQVYVYWSVPEVASLRPGETGEFSVTVPGSAEAAYSVVDPTNEVTEIHLPAGPDDAYLRGYFTASFYQDQIPYPGPLPKFTGQLTPIDALPPTLGVKVTPASVSKLSGTSLKVQAILTVTDDYDPQPEIKLESITASVPMNQSEIKGAVFGTDDRLFILPVKKDPAGKPVVYTVTYSATDGTGNKRTASATVTLNP